MNEQFLAELVDDMQSISIPHGTTDRTASEYVSLLFITRTISAANSISDSTEPSVDDVIAFARNDSVVRVSDAEEHVFENEDEFHLHKLRNLGLRVMRNSSSPLPESLMWLFEESIPQETRREAGQFGTPSTVSGVLSSWVLEQVTTHQDSSAAEVIDAGIGSGILTEALMRQQRVNVRGFDTEPLLLAMAEAASLEGGYRDRVTFEQKSYLSDASRSVDAVISNPPYVRHHGIGAEEKSTLQSRAQSRTGVDFSSLSPLYVYFFEQALADTRDREGVVAFVTPSEFLQTRYGEQLKQVLLENATIHAIVLYETGNSIFNTATSSACLTLVSSKPCTSDHTVPIVTVSGSPSKDAVLRSVSNPARRVSWGDVRQVQQQRLSPASNWSHSQESVDTSLFVELGDIATVKRGVLTGCNDFFCMDEKTVETYGIPPEARVRLLRKAAHSPPYRTTREAWDRARRSGKDVWLLVADSDTTGISEYVSYGETEGVNEMYTTSNRSTWYRVPSRPPAPILFQYMSQDDVGRFIYNKASLHTVNNLHGVWFDGEYSTVELKAMTAYLNSPMSTKVIASYGTSYGGGVSKIEPNRLEEAPVVDVKTLTDATIRDLASLFDELVSSGEKDTNALENVEGVIQGD